MSSAQSGFVVWPATNQWLKQESILLKTTFSYVYLYIYENRCEAETQNYLKITSMEQDRQPGLDKQQQHHGF